MMGKKTNIALATVALGVTISAGTVAHLSSNEFCTASAIARKITHPFRQQFTVNNIVTSKSLDEITANAKLHFEKPSPTHAPVAILDVYGTPYEMGYQQGRLLQKEAQEMITDFVEYFRAVLFDEQLDAIYTQLEPHIPQEYKEEMRGIADGSGLDMTLLQWAIAIPEFTEQMCSGYALLEGTTNDDHTYHVRILDYGTDLGAQRYPTIIIYHPTDGLQHATFGWAGFIGSVGGVNEKGLAIGEIGGWDGVSKEEETYQGTPFSLLFRKILANATTVQEAEAIVKETKQTNRYLYVFSDGKNASTIFTGRDHFESAPEGEILTSVTKQHEGSDLHPRPVNNCSYHGYYQERVHNYLRLGTGRFTLDEIMRINKDIVMGTNLQVWIFRHDTQEAWVGNATENGNKAALQPHVYIDLKQHFRSEK